MSQQVGEKVLIKKAVEVNFDQMQEVDAKEIDAELKKKLVNMFDVDGVFNQIVGEVLTVIDASMPDNGQKKAVKDLIKHAIYDGLDTLHALTDDQA